MERSRSAMVLDFGERVAALRRTTVLDAVAQVHSVLADMRKDVQLIALIQEMSVAALPKPLGAEGDHLDRLVGIMETLESMASMLPKTAIDDPGLSAST